MGEILQGSFDHKPVLERVSDLGVWYIPTRRGDGVIMEQEVKPLVLAEGKRHPTRKLPYHSLYGIGRETESGDPYALCRALELKLRDAQAGAMMQARIAMRQHKIPHVLLMAHSGQYWCHTLVHSTDARLPQVENGDLASKLDADATQKERQAELDAAKMRVHSIAGAGANNDRREGERNDDEDGDADDGGDADNNIHEPALPRELDFTFVDANYTMRIPEQDGLPDGKTLVGINLEDTCRTPSGVCDMWDRTKDAWSEVLEVGTAPSWQRTYIIKLYLHGCVESALQYSDMYKWSPEMSVEDIAKSRLANANPWISVRCNFLLPACH